MDCFRLTLSFLGMGDFVEDYLMVGEGVEHFLCQPHNPQILKSSNPQILKSSNPQQNPEISLKSAKSTRIENDKNKQDKKVQVTNVKTQTDIISPAALNFPIPRMPRKVIMRSGYMIID